MPGSVELSTRQVISILGKEVTIDREGITPERTELTRRIINAFLSPKSVLTPPPPFLKTS